MPSSRTRRAISCVTWLPKSTIRILSCAEATEGVDSLGLGVEVIRSNYATGSGLATLQQRSIRRHCERIEVIHAFLRRELDCFVADAPRNDDWGAMAAFSKGSGMDISIIGQ